MMARVLGVKFVTSIVIADDVEAEYVELPASSARTVHCPTFEALAVKVEPEIEQ